MSINLKSLFKFFFVLFFFLIGFNFQAGASWNCPPETNLVEFTSPVTGELKKWCQFNHQGKFLKHGPLGVYRKGKLVLKEFYQMDELQKVGDFKAIDGEGHLFIDSYLICELKSNKKSARCYQTQNFPQANHVFHTAKTFYDFEFPYSIKYLVNDFLSLCGVRESNGDLVCFDPSFFKLKEKLKDQKFELLDGAYVFQEKWPDGKIYQRKIAKEYFDKVTIDTKNPNYILKNFKAGKEALVHQHYGCILDSSDELDCFSRPSYGNEGVTFYNEKPFPEAKFIGASFTHFCLQDREKYARCFYFVPQAGYKQEAYLIEKLRFIGPIDPTAQKILYRDHLIWVDPANKIQLKKLKSNNPHPHPDFVRLAPMLTEIKGVQRFALHSDNFCYLNQEGELFCLFKKVTPGTRIQKATSGYQKMRPVFPELRFESIFQSSFPELASQICLKQQSLQKYFCFSLKNSNEEVVEVEF